ncbi:hypothetical protein [Craterilacuibacter sp. RT1T]|uniref:hypothetical protein n=1 Tax=Craterilacuibacter sp. RT1T TaxID=2942211 RepID=UPI0020BD689B|nr:hypothetical protein [Craterilacuibacter sp. RT1T]
MTPEQQEKQQVWEQRQREQQRVQEIQSHVDYIIKNSLSDRHDTGTTTRLLEQMLPEAAADPKAWAAALASALWSADEVVMEKARRYQLCPCARR